VKTNQPYKKQTYEGLLADIVAANAEFLARQIRKRLGNDLSSKEAEELLKILQTTISESNQKIQGVASKIGIDIKKIITEDE